MNFFERFFSLNLKDYGGPDFPLGLIFLCICIGMIAATVIIQSTNATVYMFIKALVRHKATTPENAKDLKSLGLSDISRVLRALKRENSMLLRYVARVDAQQEPAEENDAVTAAPPTESAENDQEATQATPEKTKFSAAALLEEKKQCGEKQMARILCARYYLAPQNADRAKEILSENEPTVLQTILYCSIFLVLFVIFALLFPTILPLVL